MYLVAAAEVILNQLPHVRMPLTNVKSQANISINSELSMLSMMVVKRRVWKSSYVGGVTLLCWQGPVLEQCHVWLLNFGCTVSISLFS